MALQLAEGARLEWLPSETLAFPAAEAQITTRVELGPGSAFLGWDIACYGMPARGESFTAGRVVTRFELWRGASPLAIESFDLGQGQDLLRGAHALRGEPVVATLYAVPGQGLVEAALVERVREAIGESERGLCSVTSLSDLLVVRALGPNVEGVRTQLIRAWQVLRPIIVGREAVAPRIWAT